ncbi:MAG: DUF3467 domain-containing protein [Bryobacteraceae bacterium]
MAPDKVKNEAKGQAEAPDGKLDLGKVPLQEPEDGIFETYANVVNMNWTLTDVRLRFSQLLQVADEDRPNWENQHGILLERAAITIPWIQAKTLRDSLDGIIKNYEAINGELKLPKLPARPE